MSSIKGGVTCIACPSLIYSPTSGGGKTFTQLFTVPGIKGYPMRPYGSFAGKNAGGRTYTRTFTVPGIKGYSMPPYGSFAGKP